MEQNTFALLDTGTTDAEVLQEISVVLTMVDDHFCMDRRSQFAQTLRSMIDTCCLRSKATTPED